MSEAILRTISLAKQPPPTDWLLANADHYSAEVESKVSAGNWSISDLPSAPRGPTLGLLAPELSQSSWSLADPRTQVTFSDLSLPGPEFGNHVMSIATESRKTTPQVADVPIDDSPPFPGTHGSFSDYVEWAAIQSQFKAKFPGLNGTFEEYRNYARDFLIQKGIDYIKDKVKETLTDTLTNILSGSDSVLSKTVSEVAGEAGFLQGIFGEIQKTFEKYTDFEKLKELAFTEGLPKLADLGLDKLFNDLWKLDDSSSPAEVMAHMMAEKIVREIVDSLLANVTSLEGLIDNFKNLQANLLKKLDEFWNGTPGLATLPAARIGDKDDKVDVVATGFPTVLIQKLAAARATDTLVPSGKPIVEGSATVFAGGLPLSRLSAMTAIPSRIAAGAPMVLVGGATVVVVAPPPTPPAPAAGSTVPNSAKPPINPKKLIVLVGGADDGATGIVKDGLKNTVQSQNPDAAVMCFGWMDAEKAADQIRQFHEQFPEVPIEIVGHSYGGDTAMDIAQLLNGDGITIEQLTTLDPVSWFESSRPSNVKNWTNVYVDGVHDYTDLIANAGGKWGHESGADQNIPAPLGNDPVSHGNAQGLYSAAQRSGAVSNSNNLDEPEKGIGDGGADAGTTDPTIDQTTATQRREHIKDVTETTLQDRGRVMDVTSEYRENSAAHRRGAIDIESRSLNSATRHSEAQAISRNLGSGHTVVVEEVSADGRTQTNTSYRNGVRQNTHVNQPVTATATHTHIQPDGAATSAR